MGEYIAQMDPLSVQIIRLATHVEEPWEACKALLIGIAPHDVDETLEIIMREDGRVVGAKTSKISLAFTTALATPRTTPHADDSDAAVVKEDRFDGTRMQMLVLLHPTGELNFGPLGNGYDIGTIDNVDLVRYREIVALLM